MAIVRPVIFTEILDEEVSVNRPTNEELLKKIYHNINLLGALSVVASVEVYAINIAGVSNPSPTIYQLCDGSLITELTSDLEGGNTPDARNRYIRGASASTTIGDELGGSDTINLEHNHGGFTGSANFTSVGSSGNEQFATDPFHYHSIDADLNPAEPLEMNHVQVAMYLKIN